MVSVHGTRLVLERLSIFGATSDDHYDLSQKFLGRNGLYIPSANACLSLEHHRSHRLRYIY